MGRLDLENGLEMQGVRGADVSGSADDGVGRRGSLVRPTHAGQLWTRAVEAGGHHGEHHEQLA